MNQTHDTLYHWVTSLLYHHMLKFLHHWVTSLSWLCHLYAEVLTSLSYIITIPPICWSSYIIELHHYYTTYMLKFLHHWVTSLSWLCHLYAEVLISLSYIIKLTMPPICWNSYIKLNNTLYHWVDYVTHVHTMYGVISELTRPLICWSSYIISFIKPGRP